MTDIVVIGAGPAGMLAALRAGDLGAKTVLVTSGDFGGMAANDGPVPVRTLAHAARLIRDARQLGRYGIGVNEPSLDYSRLLARVREVVHDVREQSTFRSQIESAGVTIHERTGNSRFVDPHTIRCLFERIDCPEAITHLNARFTECRSDLGRYVFVLCRQDSRPRLK